ncbi:NAD(P)-dependent dehydrogenase (short-subunit alcohol dehydrogenase family) [Pseudonocardia sediminis]|uniref:NAD(P)-dependent dehydrogenase (Short-subunit alcohol dehydrogenase family) n=1 Tax=Pseudonocardia sediminis TaxID=1397368 RepID=A0A4Q7UTQ7_PSEST|nr:SDR family oxidoreductase [Pseudonocardia sediminis]RZT84258.1 NAD(P)-dependent dehydrogenase (short-subunit alcohol dehydrogenase family) [Pseudonocardia sediminis]
MDLGLGGARVVVTGGGANIGRGIAHCFAAEGARVLVVDVDGEQADSVAAELRDLGAPDSDAVAIDLTTDGAGAAVTRRIVERWGGIDVLVNNAGWSEPGWFAQQTDRALWEKTIGVNLFAAIDCTQAALGPMREAGRGAVVFLSSDSAFGAIRQGIYGSTKAGLISLARTVAREHGRHGIRSNVVAPGLVVPPDDAPVGASSVWARGKDAMFTPEQIDSVVRTQALRRLTTPTDVGNAVVWVSSDVAARQVTGQVVAVGGGSSMP